MNARTYFDNVHPEGWSLSKADRSLKRGGQASVCIVHHNDGREGVFRTLQDLDDSKARERFSRELPILTDKLKDHPGIVKLLAWSSPPHEYWYISELGIPFGNWWHKQAARFANQPNAKAELALRVLRELTEALAACHALGIVHRDCKPDNIIIKQTGDQSSPVWIDFGIAFDSSLTERLTATDEHVGNKGFSPDMVRSRVDEPPPWIDLFELAQILIWMLDAQRQSRNWTQKLHWKYTQYDSDLSAEVEESIRAFTASCSTLESAPRDGTHALALIDRLFGAQPTIEGQKISTLPIVKAKQRGAALATLREAETLEEIQSGELLAQRIYRDIRAAVAGVMQDVSEQTPPLVVSIDQSFSFNRTGAKELYKASIGQDKNPVEVRVMTKIVTRVGPTEDQRNIWEFWRKHLADNASCFTFSVEGGIPSLDHTGYVEGRWISVMRDGSLMTFPLMPSWVHRNELGGRVTGAGSTSTIFDVRNFVESIVTSEKYWELIASKHS